MNRRTKIIVLSIIGLVFLWLFWYLKFAGHYARLQSTKVPQDFWGVTFSKKYALELGLDWRAVYLAILDDLKVKYIRLPVYWDDVEKVNNSFDYGDYDWMLTEGARRNVSFILNIGRRLPRWPECHQPGWTIGLSNNEMKQQHISAVTNMIRHFKSYSAIRSWQIENEYFFPWFGLCPKADLDLIQQEISILRSEDQRPIVLTDSGELNSWRKAASYSDVLGITIYRVVWNKYFGYFRWPWPGALYRIKAMVAGKSIADSIVAELQAEPWPADFKKVNEISARESERSFSLKQLETNAEIARRTGFGQAYFWGVEWWYWLKEQGDASIWIRARKILHYEN